MELRAKNGIDKPKYSNMTRWKGIAGSQLTLAVTLMISPFRVVRSAVLGHKLLYEPRILFEQLNCMNMHESNGHVMDQTDE